MLLLPFLPMLPSLCTVCPALLLLLYLLVVNSLIYCLADPRAPYRVIFSLHLTPLLICFSCGGTWQQPKRLKNWTWSQTSVWECPKLASEWVLLTHGEMACMLLCYIFMALLLTVWEMYESSTLLLCYISQGCDDWHKYPMSNNRSNSVKTSMRVRQAILPKFIHFWGANLSLTLSSRAAYRCQSRWRATSSILSSSCWNTSV